VFRRAFATPPHALSLRAALTIATLFWVYACLAVVLRLELTRQGLSGKGPSVGVLTTCCFVLYPVLCALTYVSWRNGYDTARWLKLVLVNVALACLFGAASRPSYILATALHQGVSFADAQLLLDGRVLAKAVKLWGSSFVEDAALYLMLQGILLGANAFVRLRSEAAQRARLAHEYDRARLQALRMQTNPHFLFNTLSAIAGLISARPAAAEAMVTQLGELFRATLEERNSELVSLDRELELGRQYLEIQRIRFDSRFDFEFDVPDDARRAAIPPLLLQPLLENAAEHGLTTREGSVVVKVSAAIEEGVACIVVRNQAAREITTQRAQGGFGLEIVRERLRAAFGGSARLETELTPDGLFQARLRFPFRKMEQGELEKAA
jgi:sensor histidine kinase YesM